MDLYRLTKEIITTDETVKFSSNLINRLIKASIQTSNKAKIVDGNATKYIGDISAVILKRLHKYALGMDKGELIYEKQ